MATASNKTPPLFNKSKSYSDWVRLVNLWTKFTDLEPTRQGPALVMSLEGKALDTILELDDKDISHKDGVTLIINKLNKLYKKDKLNKKFQDLEKFENYKRSSETPMQQFLADFDQAHNKLKRHGITICNDLLGFKLLKAANLSSHHEQLIKATINEVSYECIITKIKSIFSNDSENKLHPDKKNLTLNQNLPSIPKIILLMTMNMTMKVSTMLGIHSIHSPERSRRTTRFKPQISTYHNQKYQRQNHPSKTSTNWRNNQQLKTSKGKNPQQQNGQPTRCKICGSINHWASQCPD